MPEENKLFKDAQSTELEDRASRKVRNGHWDYGGGRAALKSGSNALQAEDGLLLTRHFSASLAISAGLCHPLLP